MTENNHSLSYLCHFSALVPMCQYPRFSLETSSHITPRHKPPPPGTKPLPHGQSAKIFKLVADRTSNKQLFFRPVISSKLTQRGEFYCLIASCQFRVRFGWRSDRRKYCLNKI